MYKYFILCLIIVGVSCDKTEPVTPVGSKGAIFVTVKYNGQIVKNAQVTTEPITSMTTTDLTGTAIISDVPIGGYKVVATHPDIGTGSAPVTVLKDVVNEVQVNLIGGVFEAPSVSIIAPLNNASLALGSDVTFSATVSDSKDLPNQIAIVWSSSLDGVLSTNPPTADGKSMFVINTLSEGEHVITLVAKDTDNKETTKHITITIKKLPNAVVLLPVTSAATGLILHWTVSDEPNFEEYSVLRAAQTGGPYQIINISHDVQQTDYTDADVLIGKRYYYLIIVSLINGDTIGSNIESAVFESDHIDVGVNIVQMLIDKTRPYIYALDKINNSLLFINKENKTVEKTIFVGSSPTDFDISLDNQKMYIANLGSNQIAVVDLVTQEKIKDLFVDTNQGIWDGNPYSLVYLTGDYIAYTSEDQFNDVKVVNASNGAFVSYVGSIHTPFLNSNPAHTIVYGLDGGDVIRYNFSGTKLTLADQTGTSSGYSRKIVVSADGLIIFRGQLKFLANNLSSQLGTLGESIYATNADGTIAIGQDNIWNATEFSIIRPMPIHSTIMELDQDNHTLYVYDNTSSKIYFVNID